MAWAQNLLGFCLFACASQTQKGWSIPETCHPSPNHCFDRPHPTLLSPLLGVGGMGGSPSIHLLKNWYNLIEHNLYDKISQRRKNTTLFDSWAGSMWELGWAVTSGHQHYELHKGRKHWRATRTWEPRDRQKFRNQSEKDYNISRSYQVSKDLSIIWYQWPGLGSLRNLRMMSFLILCSHGVIYASLHWILFLCMRLSRPKYMP